MHKDAFDAAVSALESARDSSGAQLNVESLIYTRNSVTRSHYFSEPHKVNLRSVAKPIVCLALGRAIKDGMMWGRERISLSTRIWPFLSTISGVVAAVENESAWQEITIRDLLRSTLGHQSGLLFSKDIKDRDRGSLLEYIVSRPITGRVGYDFVYSNAGVFVLSNLISSFCGVDLDVFVAKQLFSRLGIVDVKWDRYGDVVAGCTGLWMSNSDLHKIGRLLLQRGRSNWRQLVPGAYIDEMRKPQVLPPTHRFVADRAFPKWSYGLCLWICEDGNYYCDGTDGQYLVVIPKRNAVITVVASQPDTVPISDALGYFK